MKELKQLISNELNIAPMHHFKYDQLLFSLGYYLLHNEINSKIKIKNV